jgi:hypothetical protein
LEVIFEAHFLPGLEERESAVKHGQVFVDRVVEFI